MQSTHHYPHSDLTGRVIGAAMAVHTELGPGLLESCYQAALALELRARKIAYEREAAIEAVYRGQSLGVGLRADFVVERAIIVETKALDQLDPVHRRQLLTYLRTSGLKVGLLLNFGAASMRDGITRLVA